ncbi:hypothetical protein KUV51_09895 [Tateyamaria omphalii]|uniref:hypothetical protein n=1 Tax=Tateyamaria omphalii TaxID=299262 RepID=UPI001C994551|nr:hypothetical protein [Tateyamaria omphalii]MBY5933309.1 hypothetical protein [Tateyamaria omphalii]
MFRRKNAGELPSQVTDDAEEYASSNMKMLVIAAAFLMVTIVLILLQPSDATEPAQEFATVPLADDVVASAPEVTRADASLLDLQAVSASEAVSRQLRQPIRLTDTDARHTDLRSLTSAVLIGFGYTPQQGDRLQALLVQALTEGQSNAYIDALLNTAAARNEFTVPRKLTTAAGRLDTEALLVALVRQSQG